MAKSAIVNFQKNIIRGKKLGGSAASRAAKERWIPTGSLSLDYVLGGGVRVGMITMFYGEKSGGKTTSAARIAGNSQKLCRNCFRTAGRDAWHMFLHTAEDGSGGHVQVMPHGVEVVSEDGEITIQNPPREWKRVEAHDHLVEHALTLVATSADGVFYADEERIIRARLVHLPGFPDAVPPSEEEIAELGDDARWSASGFCACYAEGLFRPESEPKKEKDERPKEYAARIERWKAELTLNSYEEFVVAWVDIENSYHATWFAKLGVDNRRVLLIQPTNAEEGIDICHALALTNEIDLMVLDSIAQLVPQKEIAASMEEWQQGLQARLVNKAVRKLSSAMTTQGNRERPLTQIWINQTREKIGVMFGDPTVKPGGKGQEFAIHAEAKFKRSKETVINEQYGNKDETVSIPIEEVLSFKNTKNKTAGTKGAEGSYTQTMRDNDRGPAGTILEDDYIFKLAMHYMVVVDKKKGTYTLGDSVYTAQKALLTELRDNHVFQASVKSSLLQHMLTSRGSGRAASAAE